jgi:tryptophan synthase beta subunit
VARMKFGCRNASGNVRFKTLKDTTNEAFATGLTNPVDTYISLDLSLGPHPYLWWRVSKCYF